MEPCIRIRDEEIRRVKRKLVRVAPEGLARLTPPESSILGTILCPGDTTEALAAWARKGKDRAGRIWFYAHPETEVRSALAGWIDAGLRTDQVDFVRSWEELHPLFGLALNDCIFWDFQ